MQNNETYLSSVVRCADFDCRDLGGTFTPKIGIVIPIYNVAQYLQQCLDSVLAQSYGNFYAVLVNDGSTDYIKIDSNDLSLRESTPTCHSERSAKHEAKNLTNQNRDFSLNVQNDDTVSESLQIALEYVAKDSRFCCFDKANGGLSSARNVGIDYFGGEYNSSLAQSLQELEKSALDRRPALSRTDFPAQHTNLAQDTRIATFQICINSAQITLYTNPNRTNPNPPKIDYIIFLDSDDYWEANLLESCVETMNTCHTEAFAKSRSISNLKSNNRDILPMAQYDNMDISVAPLPQYDKNLDSSLHATHSLKNDNIDCHEFDKSKSHNDALPDIVWFSWNNVFEFTSEQDHATRERERNGEFTWLTHYGFTQSAIISNAQWLESARTRNIRNFACAWDKCINFSHLQKIGLRFLDGVLWEDMLFAQMLFAESKHIAVLPKKLTNYRIRQNNITNFTCVKQKNLPPFIKPLQKHFRSANKAWEYLSAVSWCEMGIMFASFCENLANKEIAKLLMQTFFGHYLTQGRAIYAFVNDPCNAKPKMAQLLKSLGKTSPYLPRKIKRYFTLYTSPKLWRLAGVLAYLSPAYSYLKGLERRFRAWRRQWHKEAFKKSTIQ